MVDRDLGYKQYMAMLRSLGGSVEVGFLEGISSPESVEKSVLNELGTRDAPPRPHVAPAFDEERRGFVGKVARKVGKALRQRGIRLRDARNDVLIDIAVEIGERIKDNIVQMDKPANSTSTVARKGFDNPLIETGKMARDVAWRAYDKKGKIIDEGRIG